ncbi:MAG: hypothetical protein V3U95_04520, partial [Dehalococcoidia bacterium]
MVAVPEAYLRSIGFLCVDEPDGYGNMHRTPKATAFFVRVPLESTIAKASVDYLVTARHCIEEAMSYGSIFIRWNRKQGPFIEVETRCADWHLHDNADVAAILMLPTVLPKGTQITDFDSASLSINEFVGAGPYYEFKGETQSDIGPISVEVRPTVGYEAFFLGLFTQHYGEDRTLPIARFGHISRMPGLLDMKHPDGSKFQALAYLMEFQSWGGHSGSPVFFLHPMIIEDHSNVQGGWVTTAVNHVHVSGFMGLISGHYDISKQAKTTGETWGTVQTSLNSGIAIVTPAEAVRQLLMREDIVKQRKERAEKLLKDKPMPTMD